MCASVNIRVTILQAVLFGIGFSQIAIPSSIPTSLRSPISSLFSPLSSHPNPQPLFHRRFHPLDTGAESGHDGTLLKSLPCTCTCTGCTCNFCTTVFGSKRSKMQLHRQTPQTP